VPFDAVFHPLKSYPVSENPVSSGTFTEVPSATTKELLEPVPPFALNFRYEYPLDVP
jgi:hypothetical protein